MKPAERIVADGSQGNDLVARLQALWIIHIDGDDLRVTRQIVRPSIMNFCQPKRLLACGPRHVFSFSMLMNGPGRALMPRLSASASPGRPAARTRRRIRASIRNAAGNSLSLQIADGRRTRWLRPLCLHHKGSGNRVLGDRRAKPAAD